MALVPSNTILSTDVMGRVAPPITASVGRDAANRPGDVFVIQSLLNDRLPKPHSPVPVTGVADVGTTLAIQAYQAVMVDMNPPSGVVEPGSKTYYSLAARPLVDDAPKTSVGHYGEVPPEVINRARIGFIDTMGVMLAGSREEVAHIVLDMVKAELDRIRPRVAVARTARGSSRKLARAAFRQ